MMTELREKDEVAIGPAKNEPTRVTHDTRLRLPRVTSRFWKQKVNPSKDPDFRFGTSETPSYY